MLHAILARATMASAFIVLVASPALAHAQLSGLVNSAKQAVHHNQAQATRNTTVPITSDNLDAYIRGYRAEKAEEHRMDSVEVLASSTPASARSVDLMRCESEAIAGSTGSPADLRADSVRAMKLFAGIDTVKIKELTKAAQAGDAAAIAQLQAISMQIAQRQAADPATMARSQQLAQQMKAGMERSRACEKSTPPASSYASRISSAKAEMSKYGSRSSAAYTSHLDSVKLSAAGGMSPAQYAALDERIRGFLASSTDPSQGYTQAELQTLHAHRTDLQSLTN